VFGLFQAVPTSSTPAPPTTGLKAWFKADAGVTASGSNVTAWADQSGNGFDLSQPGGTDQPQLVSSAVNGLPGISFEGPTFNAILGNPTALVIPTFDGARHVFYVAKTSTSVSLPWYGGCVVEFNHGPGSVYMDDCFGGPNPYTTSTAIATGFNQTFGQPYLFDQGRDVAAGSLFFNVNGVSQTPLSTTLPDGDGTQPGLYVGCDVENAQGAYLGVICELLIFDHVLAGADLAAARTYLTNRYGI
jgi:hypothetical protein